MRDVRIDQIDSVREREREREREASEKSKPRRKRASGEMPCSSRSPALACPPGTVETFFFFFLKLLEPPCRLPSLHVTHTAPPFPSLLFPSCGMRKAALIEFSPCRHCRRVQIYIFCPLSDSPLLCARRLAADDVVQSFKSAPKATRRPRGRRGRPSYINSVAKCRRDNNDLNRCQ